MLIATTVRLGCSKWKLAESAAAVLSYHDRDDLRPQKQRRPMDVILLGLVSEITADFSTKKWAFHLESFMAFTAKPVANVANVAGM